jgi:hypothetical protein
MYIDRVCFRLPDSLLAKLTPASSSSGLPNNGSTASSNSNSSSKKKRGRLLQRSLTPHLDCCPQDIAQSLLNHSGNGGGRDITSTFTSHKWRPIQSFIALTDTLHPDQGGFEACPGLHKRFSRWTEFRLPSNPNHNQSVSASAPPPCVGSFTPIRPIEDRDIIRQFEHIPCRAGDLVCWDHRIPHSNARHNNKDEAREVVYLGYLPYIHLNAAYAKVQLQDYLHGTNPSDQWIHNNRKDKDNNIVSNNNIVSSDGDGGQHQSQYTEIGRESSYVFSHTGRMMMGMEIWPEPDNGNANDIIVNM